MNIFPTIFGRIFKNRPGFDQSNLESETDASRTGPACPKGDSDCSQPVGLIRFETLAWHR
jgi:hypothetical protein